MFWRIGRGVLLAVAGVLLMVAWMLARDFLDLAWSALPSAFRRRAAYLYLDALLIGYAVAWVLSILLIGGVLVRWRWSRAGPPAVRRRQVRLLAVGAAILVSVVFLDIGAAAWSAWQDRTFRLPDVPVRLPVRAVAAGQPDGTDGPASEQDPPETSPAKAELPVPPGRCGSW